MTRRHHGRELARDIEAGSVLHARRRGVLAGEDGARVDRLALSVDERVGLVEGLRWREPLESRGRRRGGEDDEDRGVVREGDAEVAASDWVGRREREWERHTGIGVDDGVNGDRASVEGEWARVRVREREKSRAMDGRRREVKVEREGDVSREWVSRIGERVRVNGRH